jgi:YidC/Oxa1 family membrane protein insertase
MQSPGYRWGRLCATKTFNLREQIMNQKRQFFGYLIIFLVSSLLWQGWEQISSKKSEENINQSQNTAANSHIDSVAKISAMEAAPRSRTIEVTTDLLHVVIDRLGGRIVEVGLLDYKKEKGKDQPVSLIGQDVHSLLTSQVGLTGDSAVEFASSSSSYVLGTNNKEIQVSLRGTNKSGISFTKSFNFQRGKYKFVVDSIVSNSSDSDYSGHYYGQFRQFIAADAGANKGMLERFFSATRFNTFTGVSYYSNQDHYTKMTYSDIDEKMLDKNIVGGWMAVQKPYFLGAWVPQNNQVNHLYSDQKSSYDGKLYTVGMLGRKVIVHPGEDYKNSMLFYGGPEIAANLKPIAKGLDLTVDYGWLWMLANGLFWLLSQINLIVNNWGISIILVTCFVKAVFYKMSEASYKSIAKMKGVQPRLEALKKLHADDREKLGIATRDLFKKEKVNPLGGCLPILIQIPFFIALYYVLIESVQLRHAPFMLWIQDLSAPDPLFVLPVLMGVSMFLQQKLNPKPEDPIQEKMMYFFPVFLTVLFLSFPSGLVLYWVTNNVLSILQQWSVARSIK